MLISHAWAMPSGDTFSIHPVRNLLARLPLGTSIIDPFARNTTVGHWRNDLNPETTAQFHLHAEDFADELAIQCDGATAILFDPPYSYRQCTELYASIGRQWLRDDQQQVGRWSRLKTKLAALCLPNAIVISFGWNSSGFGKKRGFEKTEVLLINHGSAHNDTIVTVERKC